MKLATFVSSQGPAVGAVLEETIADLSGEFPSMLALIDGGDAASRPHERLLYERRAGRSPARGCSRPSRSRAQIRDFNNFEQHIRDAPWAWRSCARASRASRSPSRAKCRRSAGHFQAADLLYQNRFNVSGTTPRSSGQAIPSGSTSSSSSAFFIGRRGKNIPARARPSTSSATPSSTTSPRAIARCANGRPDGADQGQELRHRQRDRPVDRDAR